MEGCRIFYRFTTPLLTIKKQYFQREITIYQKFCNLNYYFRYNQNQKWIKNDLEQMKSLK